MNGFTRRVLSLLLCICLTMSTVSVVAYADETDSTLPAETPVGNPTEALTEAVVDDVNYVVNYYKWDSELDDYVLLESEMLAGKPGEQTAAEEKAFDSLILMDEIIQTEISADGTTVVPVYYIADQEAAVFAGSKLYDTTVSNDYFKVIEEVVYDLAPGAQEYGFTLNNAEGNDRKLVHVFAVDTKNEDIEVMPGYWAIDKLDPDNLPLDGIADKSQYWKAEQLTKTVKYYEGMGYNVVGAMNTALAYDSDAPYGYMVWNGVVLGTPEVHKGAQTYLAIDWDGNCELRSMATPLTGNEKTAISANFGWLVKDGVLQSKTVERTSSDASRSMIGIKADGTLIFCHVDGRQGDMVSGGLSNYEMGEMMLALGCVNAVNCDGGGSSTFVSKRAGETENTMRSIPSDGSERATINSVILVSTAGATGIFNNALIDTEYNYIAPGAHMAFDVTALDTKGFTMDIPAEVTYQVAEDGMGAIVDGVFTAGSAIGTATIQAIYNGEVVGQKVLNVVHPKTFGFAAEETVLPYGKDMTLEVVTSFGADNWVVCVDGAYTFTLSDEKAATLEGDKLIGTTDETIKSVSVTVTYTPDPSKTDVLKVEFGKGSEIVFDFEDGDISNFMGVDEMYDWAKENGAAAPIQSNGNYSEDADSATFLATTANGGKVRNGNNALGVTLDYTDAQFASWSYNMFFYTGEPVILRDVANGMNATTFGMWVYIPEGAAGLAMQIQGTSKPDYSNNTGAHFYFTTTSGAVKNLNSCTEADIPESRWVYATCDLTAFGDFFATFNPYGEVGREPSFIRFYVKPTTAANLTFYFDDFTLDYSSAVDDRVLPTISEVSYATQDEAKELANGTTIVGNTVTFTANVADNQKLNAETGIILVDGIAVETSVSGKVISSEAVTLTSGTHTVIYEIQDALGNPARAIRTFTVAGDAAISLSGHNDGGFKPGDLATAEGAPAPEYGSVYYMDLMAAGFGSLKSVTTTLKLQSANTWEPAGIVVAPGFVVDSVSVNEYSNELTITVTKVSPATIEEGTPLVSIPVRLWTWDGVNHVTDAVISPETQYATGNNPVVDIDCEVTYGKAEYTTGVFGAFGGKVTVDTKINDVVFPWHYHDAELTTLDKEATCSEAGYTGRTYCETCKSVIDWGSKTEATGHNYVIVDDQLVCDCGDALTTTGIVEVNGKLYCMIAGKLVAGWQNVNGKWCYVDEATMEVKTGEFTVNKITYTAGEDGLLVSGTWVEDYLGKRYSFGPDFYKRCFVTIDGAEYYFVEKTGYALTGYQTLPDNRNDPNAPVRWYHFAEDGKLIERMTMTGVLDTGYGLFYMEEGCVTFAGMVKVGDDYYCVADKKGTVLTGYQWVGSYIMANSKNPMANGHYEFGADGKMLQGIVSREDGTYYYEMGKPFAAGWVKKGEDYYVFGNDGKAMTGRNWVGSYLTQTSKDPYKSGSFIFAKDGKLANGVVEADDGWYYCVAGVGKEAGLVCIDGQYYYADVNGKLATGRIWVGTYPSNGLLPKGYYEFGANGQMLNGVIEKADGTYYYEVGRPVDTGWLKVGDDYYVFTNGGKALTGANWVGSYLTETSRDPYRKGNFYFGADGKLANGIAALEDGYYYYEKGVAKAAGLIKIGDDYYLAEDGGKLATGRVWVGTYASNGLLNKGYYEFGTDGAMLQGVVEKADGLYYYNLGNTQYLGLIERDGEYYYVNEGGKLEIGRVWVGTYASNGLVTKGYYEFGEDGAMLNGFEQLADGLYYYNMGVARYYGLKVIGNDLYYIEEGGKVMTGKVYVGTYASNGLLPKGTYTFDADGKFVK